MKENTKNHLKSAAIGVMGGAGAAVGIGLMAAAVMSGGLMAAFGIVLGFIVMGAFAGGVISAVGNSKSFKPVTAGLVGLATLAAMMLPVSKFFKPIQNTGSQQEQRMDDGQEPALTGQALEHFNQAKVTEKTKTVAHNSALKISAPRFG